MKPATLCCVLAILSSSPNLSQIELSRSIACIAVVHLLNKDFKLNFVVYTLAVSIFRVLIDLLFYLFFSVDGDGDTNSCVPIGLMLVFLSRVWRPIRLPLTLDLDVALRKLGQLLSGKVRFFDSQLKRAFLHLLISSIASRRNRLAILHERLLIATFCSGIVHYYPCLNHAFDL